MSVSPLTKSVLEQISPSLPEQFENGKSSKGRLEKLSKDYEELASKKKGKFEKEIGKLKKDEDIISFGGEIFAVKKVKGKRQAFLPYESFIRAARSEKNINELPNVKGKIVYSNEFTLLEGEKLSLILRLVRALDLSPLANEAWGRKENINIAQKGGAENLLKLIPNIMRIAVAKAKSKEYGFICLFTDGSGTYCFKVSRGFSTALNESLSSLETLADEKDLPFTNEDRERLNKIYRFLHGLY